MSYTQFSAQASCEVVEGFNLDSFLDGLMKRCVQEDNFIAQEYGLDRRMKNSAILTFTIM